MGYYDKACLRIEGCNLILLSLLLIRDITHDDFVNETDAHVILRSFIEYYRCAIISFNIFISSTSHRNIAK